ncbi:FAD-dependent oxidoreductase [Tessaracoccus antarcticus]|uniref:NAD(P)/FAD-dependent oxidoreductase n=1 Tax=Tessaracoccus antarcticus TaxID=2479848 RepID=A0A3M0GAZ6_9ACTN|nr:FAD-dependent oxidoreductase [Tessaracoccus antarcticus]RMB61487.1 NAD(P)/FAD-dependent oxidoreductase [Tessaracoccus antarcticus]
MEHHAVLIVGGGNAGISLAARLLRDGARDVAVVESESVHRYRPLLNYVGGGEATMATLERPAASVMPHGCTWIHDEVVSVDPDAPSVAMRDGRRITCDTLVICTGLEEDWDTTPGLAESYAAGWAGSTFIVETAPLVWPALRDLTAGRVVFAMPAEPAPCSATALKPLFMACDHWRQTGVLKDMDVHLVLPDRSPIGVPKADRILEQALESYGVHVLRNARVTSLDDRRVTITTPDGTHALDGIAYAHVIPQYRAPRWIVEGGLSGRTGAGLVDVDSYTLQHPRHPAVWSLGDVADLGIKPSGGALRKQVVVLSHNILAAGTTTFQRYDGYTVMPITVARHRLMLVEVNRVGRSEPSLPLLDLVRPRRATWWVDRYALPQVYFRRILRGKV